MKTFQSLFPISIVLWALISLMSCKTQLPPSTIKWDAERVSTNPGPEDMVLDTVNGNPRAIISCSARRKTEEKISAIQSLMLNTGEVKTLTRLNEPDDLDFHPHGIDLCYTTGKLYVVNHATIGNYEGSSILVYQLHGDTLYFLSQLTTPLIVSPNDVAVNRKGDIYVTNDSHRKSKFGKILEAIFRIKDCNIIRFDGKSWAVFANKLSFANGIQVRHNKMVVSSTLGGDIRLYTLSLSGQIKDISELVKFKGPDNITFLNEEEILVASHPSFRDFLKHAKSGKHNSPCIVYKANIYTGQYEVWFSDNGDRISANSVALLHGNELLIGQVFNNFILICHRKDGGTD